MYTYIYIYVCIYTSRKPWGVSGEVQSLTVHQRIPAEHTLWRMQDAQVLDSPNSSGCAPELRAVVTDSAFAVAASLVEFHMTVFI